MKPKNIKHFILSFFCVTALFANTNVSAQIKQVQETDQNKQVSQEIEMMREIIRERREQQEEQKRVLQELQRAAGIDAPTPPVAQPRYQEPEPSYQPEYRAKQERVTSGNILSQIETDGPEEMEMLQQKYDIEIQVAQKEIEMLKKQLTIANRQLDKCQESSLSVNNNSFSDNMNRPALSESTTKAAKPQKQKNVKKQATQDQSVAQPQPSSENEQAKKEIEAMRNMIRQRHEQQEQQRKMILELQQALN